MMEEGTIGTQIRGLREAVGCERPDLAEALGLDPAEIAEVELGRRTVGAEDVAAAAEFRGVSLPRQGPYQPLVYYGRDSSPSYGE